MKTTRFAAYASFAMLLSACQVLDDNETSIAGCDIEAQKAYVKASMQDDYLWYDAVPNVNLDNYDNGTEVLEAMKVSQDRWSYMADLSDFQSFFGEGEFVGVGIQTQRDEEAGEIRVVFVYPDSPAAEIGLLRGDYIISVNGFSATQLMNNSTWNTAWGDSSVGVAAEIVARTPGQSERTLNTAKALVQIDTTPVVEVIDAPFGKVGYLMFMTFISPSEQDLAEAFALFSAANVSELVLDLRYNGGGQIRIAQQLGSLIGGMLTTGQVFTLLRHNDRHTDLDSTFYFTSPTNALGIDRIVVLTTDSTCSASESVINGLRPFINVATVGTTTCGKPVGMSPDTNPALCRKVMSAINFRGENASQETDFFDGFEPTCEVSDDIDHALGDSEEALLSTALDLLQNGQCPVQSVQAQSVRGGQFRPHYEGWHNVINAY